MNEPTDIVMSTKNRLDLLQRSVARLMLATREPYRLHVIDDGSEDGTTEWLWQEYRAGHIYSLVLKSEPHGRMPGRNLAAWLGFSDPFIITDDDILCPMLEGECWLGRMLSAMRKCPQVGIMALNHPKALRRDYGQAEGHPGVVLCQVVGNTYMMVRRAVVEGWSHPHFYGNFGVTDEHDRCERAQALKYKVAYLEPVYCYHMGKVNADGGPTTGPLLEPINWSTLEVADD